MQLCVVNTTNRSQQYKRQYRSTSSPLDTHNLSGHNLVCALTKAAPTALDHIHISRYQEKLEQQAPTHISERQQLDQYEVDQEARRSRHVTRSKVSQKLEESTRYQAREQQVEINQ
jgi:hypothetical protein